MSVSRIQLASVMARGASLAGTCLMQTTIFIRTSRLSARGATYVSTSFVAPAFTRAFSGQAHARLKAGATGIRTESQLRLAGIPALEQQRGVGPAKAEGVR